MSAEAMPITFMPSNEPYLGRKMLFHFDQLISSVMELNAEIAPSSHNRKLSDQQQMACQVIAQSISIALSIRELIRQGYLFGGHVLLRALVERQAILFYLHLYPEEIEKWNRGWHHGDAPGLAKMLEKIQTKLQRETIVRGSELTAAMNSLIHAKPDSAPWNMVSLGNTSVGHAVSKILNRPDLCDDLCVEVIPVLVVVQAMMVAYFPGEP